MAYESVDRPSYGRGRRTKHDYDSIIATAVDGRAVRIPLNGYSRDGLLSSLSGALNRRGYKCHSHYADGDSIIVWAEKIEAKS